MKRTNFIISVFVTSGFLFAFCQNSNGYDANKKQDAISIESRKNQLSESDQKFIEKITEYRLATPNSYKSEKEAIKHLKVLLKGNHKSIRFFRGYDSEDKQKQFYGEAIMTALSAINIKNKETAEFIAEIINTKTEYPEALEAAAIQSKFSQDRSLIPLLQYLIKNKNPKVRYEAAGSLISLGDADTALPVLEKLADQEGFSGALYYLFRDKGEIIDERGYMIVEKALNFRNAEVRISAANLLLESKRLNKAKVEEIALQTLKNFKSEKQYGITHDAKRGIIPIPGAEKNFENSNQQRKSDWRAIEKAIFILENFRSKKSIPFLEKLASNPDASYLATTATSAIESLKK